MSVFFAELTSPQAGELLRADRVPVLLLPIGAVEPHGPHAPLATDTLISTEMCERAALALAGDPSIRALVLPALPYGVTRYGAAFAGTVGVAPATLRSLVGDVLNGLREQGFTRVVVVNNHFEPEHAQTLREACAEAGVAYLDLVRRRHAERLTDEFRSGSCHAGRYETSIVLAVQPSLVDAERAAALPPLHVDMPAAMEAGAADFLALGMPDAYCGAPAEATAEEGEATLSTLTAMLVETIREVAA